MKREELKDKFCERAGLTKFDIDKLDYYTKRYIHYLENTVLDQANPLDAVVREWEDMDNAPKDQPLILKDDNGFIYVGEYNHNYGYFGQYTDEGVVEHQHAMKWKPLPTA